MEDARERAGRDNGRARDARRETREDVRRETGGARFASHVSRLSSSRRFHRNRPTKPGSETAVPGTRHQAPGTLHPSFRAGRRPILCVLWQIPAPAVGGGRMEDAKPRPFGGAVAGASPLGVSSPRGPAPKPPGQARRIARSGPEDRPTLDGTRGQACPAAAEGQNQAACTAERSNGAVAG